MKKNLKLIKKDRDHKQTEERLQKIYEKLKINLDPIIEDVKFRDIVNQVNTSLIDASMDSQMLSDIKMVQIANPITTKNHSSLKNKQKE